MSANRDFSTAENTEPRDVNLGLRVAIYARYSSDLQRAASIEDQVRICRERAEREGWHVAHVYQDRAISGATNLRPGYQAMLAAAQSGAFDVVVAEALDRRSRDQEDVARLYKRLDFAGIKILTLSEGEVSELHIGLTGTMNAMFLRQLGAKSHRGMRGRVEAGKSGGGITYGYDLARRSDGSVIVGDRTINPMEAGVVLRIFKQYGVGLPPKKIALALNAEGITAPRGGAWTGSTINGNRARGTGIINNEMYVGRHVWNPLVYKKDPETRRRRSLPRPAKDLIVKELPDLRIVPDDLWDRAKARQARLDKAAESARLKTADNQASGPAGTTPAPPQEFWTKQRPNFYSPVSCGAAPAIRDLPKSARNILAAPGRVLKGQPSARCVARSVRMCWRGQW